MQLVYTISIVLSVLLLGVLVGAWCLIAGSIQPYISAMDPAQALDWFASNNKFFTRFFIPLGPAVLLALLVATATGWSAPAAGRGYISLSFVLYLATFVLYFVWFLPVNQQIEARTLPLELAPSALTQWRQFHLTRTIVGVVAFAASVRALWLLARQAPAV